MRLAALALVVWVAAQPEGAPAPGADLTARLGAIDERARGIEDLSANFEQRKHTALLREPMISSGTVAVRDRRVLWETQRPRPSTLAVQEDRATIYYPQLRAAEVYPLRAEMRLLAASPLPSFARLGEAFEITETDAADLREGHEAGLIGLQLAPRDGPMRDHIDRVRALLDPEIPAIVALEMVDADGDRTVIRFQSVRINTGLTEAEVTLRVPAGVEVSYPLGPVEPAGAAPAPAEPAR